MNRKPENIITFPKQQEEAPQRAPVFDPLAPTVFHQPWWLEIATRGNYNYVEFSEHGEVVGRLPYFPRKRFGMNYSIMPPMTHFVGPAIVEGDGSYATRFLRKATIIRELITQLPEASLYQYKCHRDITDTIAFQQEQFMTNVQFTHEIMPQPEEILWKQLRTSKRQKIRQAQKLHTVCEIYDAQEFWRFYDSNLQKRGTANVCEQELCCDLIQTSIERKQGRIYATRDQNGDLTSAVFFIWDATSYFYFMSSRTMTAHNGAISLIVWEALKDAASRGLIFDFDGINHANAVLFFTDFGGVISPRYIVTRHTLAGGLAMAWRDRGRNNRHFY